MNEAIVLATLRSALADASDRATGEVAEALRRAAESLGALGEPTEPHPGLPALGTSTEEKLVVGEEDTAAAMGHPDQAMAVLGSPRLALWFELVSTSLLPEPDSGLTSVGAGILVHHLARAEAGEEVTVGARVVEVAGRRVVFACEARTDDRLVGFGTHHRVLISASPPQDR